MDAWRRTSRENVLHTPPPPSTTRLTAGTDWLLCHPQFSREAPPPKCGCSPSRLPALRDPATWHGQGTQARREVSVKVALTTFTCLDVMPTCRLSRCRQAALLCLSQSVQIPGPRTLSHLAPKLHWTR